MRHEHWWSCLWSEVSRDRRCHLCQGAFHTHLCQQGSQERPETCVPILQPHTELDRHCAQPSPKHDCLTGSEKEASLSSPFYCWEAHRGRKRQEAKPQWSPLRTTTRIVWQSRNLGPRGRAFRLCGALPVSPVSLQDAPHTPQHAEIFKLVFHR